MKYLVVLLLLSDTFVVKEKKGMQNSIVSKVLKPGPCRSPNLAEYPRRAAVWATRTSLTGNKQCCGSGIVSRKLIFPIANPGPGQHAPK